MDSKKNTPDLGVDNKKTDSGMIRINLGCWKDIKPGWINCDFYIVNDSVMKIDLRELPLPFEDNYADEIYLSHVLEHLQNPYDIVMECHRVLKPGGILNVKLPIHANRLEHASFYHQKNYFQNLYRQGAGQNYGGRHFELLSVKKHILPCRARIKERYYRLISWVDSLIYLEYQWMLKKK